MLCARVSCAWSEACAHELGQCLLMSLLQAVFAHPIDWTVFDAARSTLAPRLSGWVDKKIQDMLGEREESMVCFLRCDFPPR